MSNKFNNPNDFSGNDSERIAAAVNAAQNNHLPVVISRRRATDSRDFWLLDSAIVIGNNIELVIDNATIKLLDRCRDNFIRSSNISATGEVKGRLRGISIRGVGEAKFIGADHPRATGDSAKTLGVQTYGSDAGKKDENPKGDWRNLGIRLANVDCFSLENLHFIDSHCWAVTLENCRAGWVKNLHFESTGGKIIDGKREPILNQDGLDLRRGCRNIIVEDITGFTGDDLVAVTALPVRGADGKFIPPDDEAHVSGIIIRNVTGYCAGGHHIVRFLNSGGVKLTDVVLDGVTDTSPAGICDRASNHA